MCGGYTYSDGGSDVCYKYSTLSDSWQEYGIMPSERAYSASAYVENFGLVMAGGYDYGITDSVIVTKDGYTFETLDSLPSPSDYGCLAVIDEQTLLLTGGYGDYTGVHSYDIPSDVWTRYMIQSRLLVRSAFCP